MNDEQHIKISMYRIKIKSNIVGGIKYHAVITSASRKYIVRKKLDTFQQSITFAPSLTGNDHISTSNVKLFIFEFLNAFLLLI